MTCLNSVRERPSFAKTTMETIRERLFQARIVAIVRGDYSTAEIDTIVISLVEGGIKALEITANSADWQRHLQTIGSSYGKEILLGAGTILDLEEAAAAEAAGAKFIISPHFDAELVRWSVAHGLEPIPGVVTPTEIVSALRQGAEIVKLFPASHFGAGYVRALRAPLNQAEFMVTGGVDATNIRSFFEAGARMAGIGGNLVPKQVSPGKGPDERILRTARQLLACIDPKS